MAATDPRRIAIGVTGASGAVYAIRTIAALMELGCHLDIVVSEYGRRLLTDELGPEARVDRLRDLLIERLHDPEAEKSLVILFFDSEEDYRRGDAALNAMPAADTPGQRTSVTRYDVAFRMTD